MILFMGLCAECGVSRLRKTASSIEGLVVGSIYRRMQVSHTQVELKRSRFLFQPRSQLRCAELCRSTLRFSGLEFYINAARRPFGMRAL